MGDGEGLKELLCREARDLGFALVGVAAAGPAARPERFSRFLQLGYHADMAYLARQPERRADGRNLLPGARTVICLAASYAPAGEEGQGPGDVPPAGAGQIARYARGRDYHRLLRGRCRRLVLALRRAVPALRARTCVDTAPVLERDLAASAGLGWIGRNGCLIHPRLGSYLLLAEIVTDLDLPADAPVANGCGRCRACLEACPTGAIMPDGLVDCRRCLSYLSIEHRGDIPESLRPAMGARVFGCDRCQEVCPHNRRAPAGEAELRGPSGVAQTGLAGILRWDRQDWDRLTRGTAARRARWEMFLRNAAIAAGNAGDPALRPLLERLAGAGCLPASEAARWALDRLARAPTQARGLTPPAAEHITHPEQTGDDP